MSGACESAGNPRLDPQLGSLSVPQTLNGFVYCVNNPVRFVDPSGSHFVVCGSGSEGGGNRDEWNNAVRNEQLLRYGRPDAAAVMDELMFYAGFVPGLDTAADAWFTYRAWKRGDEAGVGIGFGCLLMPGVSGSYYRGGKAGYRYADDLLRHADDVPTGPGVRSADDLPIDRRLRPELIKHTGVNPGSAFEAHHIFPKKFRTIFWKEYGIDVNDPRYGTWVDAVSHRQWSRAYNDQWEEFLLSGHTLDEVFAEARRLGGLPRFDFGAPF